MPSWFIIWIRIWLPHDNANTTVDGYWLDSDGVRQEKSQEDIDRENREAAKKASKPNPGKSVAAAKVAAS
ncbi:MAG: hypothetical protein ACLUD2_08195 [Clostridium sp.]